jgi:integrase/recombinase XerD
MAAEQGPLVEEYLTWLQVERGRSANTLEAYRRDLRAYELFLDERGVEIDGVGEADLVAFAVELRQRGLAPASSKRTLVAVRNLHKYLRIEDHAPTDPGSALELPSPAKSVPKALSEEEVTAILDSAQSVTPAGYRDRAILEVLYGTGVRISELCGMSISDVNFDDQMTRVVGKGDKERLVPLGRFAAQALREWLGPNGRPLLEPKRWRTRTDADAVFLNQRGGRLTRQGAWGVVRQYAETVGLEDRVHPHVFRHSCATHMLNHGADIRTVQELLGHASLTTTQIYTKVSTDRLKSAYDLAHPRATIPRHKVKR